MIRETLQESLLVVKETTLEQTCRLQPFPIVYRIFFIAEAISEPRNEAGEPTGRLFFILLAK